MSLVRPSSTRKGDVSGGGKEKEEEVVAVVVGRRNGFCLGGEERKESSSESSSIGVTGESSLSLSSTDDPRGDGGEEEAQSEMRKDDPLGCLDCLEESLPIKRGLSNFFNGKSKSFASLSDVVTLPTSELAKPEIPFNKRRRILAASKSSRLRRASCSSLNTMASQPPLLTNDLLSLKEDEEEEDEDHRNKGEGNSPPLAPPLPPHMTKLKSFKPTRSFSLGDLQQHDNFS